MSRRKRRWEREALPTVPGTSWRQRFGAFLPALMMSSLLPTFFISLISGQSRRVLGVLIGIGLCLWAAERIRTASRRRALRSAAILIGLATAFAAHLAGGAPSPIALVLGFMAGYGAHLLYGDLLTAEPEIAPEPPMPAPGPAAPEEPALLSEGRSRLRQVRAIAQSLPEPGLLRAADALEAVLDDLVRTPQHLPEARRFLVVQLDGLGRIAERLGNGAAAPEGLPSLLDEMTGAARGLQARLRAHESEALAIQVKVLQERLRQEGYGPGTGTQPGHGASDPK